MIGFHLRFFSPCFCVELGLHGLFLGGGLHPVSRKQHWRSWQNVSRLLASEVWMIVDLFGWAIFPTKCSKNLETNQWHNNVPQRRGLNNDSFLLGQWLNFKLFGITYLVGKIKFKLFFRVHWLSEYLEKNWSKTFNITKYRPALCHVQGESLFGYGTLADSLEEVLVLNLRDGM